MLVVGMGGLGHPAASRLVEMGLGRLGIVDPDHVELSNLPRQLLFREEDVGRPKVEIASQRLRMVAGDTIVEPHQQQLTRADASLVVDYDLIVDATDSLASKMLVHDVALEVGKPLVHAGVTGDQGQLFTVLPGRGACLRCIFPAIDAAEPGASCAEAGVLGALVGVFGAMQAAEAALHLNGLGAAWSDRLLAFDHGRWIAVPTSIDRHCRCQRRSS